MRLSQGRWSDDSWTIQDGDNTENASTENADVVFAFGSTESIESKKPLKQLQAACPNAIIAGCSTGGVIQEATVTEQTLAATIISFDATETKAASARIEGKGESFSSGKKIAKSLSAPDLNHLILLSGGIEVNGSKLVDGVRRHLPDEVSVSGGLAADGERFQRTPLWLNEIISKPSAVGIGLYGDRLQVGHGCLGGWDPFGPCRLISHSEGDVLYELDNQSALNLYKRYLGSYAEDLPASGLRFPLAIEVPGKSHEIVRTVVGVDEENESIHFSGNMPEGTYARFMKSNKERLIDGAAGAAEASLNGLENSSPELALLISCIGRKLVLQQRTEEEVEQAGKMLGTSTELIGFYSNGEISPAHSTSQSELHNQTMTITTFSER